MHPKEGQWKFQGDLGEGERFKSKPFKRKLEYFPEYGRGGSSQKSAMRGH